MNREAAERKLALQRREVLDLILLAKERQDAQARVDEIDSLISLKNAEQERKAWERKFRSRASRVSLSDLNLNTRVRIALKRHKIETTLQLVVLNLAQVLEMRTIGPKWGQEIVSELKKHGLSLRPIPHRDHMPYELKSAVEQVERATE